MTLRTAGLLGGGFGSCSPANAYEATASAGSVDRTGNVLDRFVGDPLDDADHQRIAHHEGAFPIRHPRSPVTREAVEPLELPRVSRRYRPSSAPDDVLEPRRGRATFPGEDRPRRTVGRVREWDGSLVVRVLHPCRAADARQALRSLEELPLRELLALDEELRRNVFRRLEDIGQDLSLAVRTGRTSVVQTAAPRPVELIRITPAFPNGVFLRPKLNVSLTTFTSGSSMDRRPVEDSFSLDGSARARTPERVSWSYRVSFGTPASTDDEHASALLREAVVSGVDDAPLDFVSESASDASITAKSRPRCPSAT